jgi:hypothetical protein
MPFRPVTQQIRSYFNKDGTPLNGTIRFGTAGQDPEVSPIAVFWDKDGTQPAAQPIRIRNGYPVRGRTPANVFIDGDFSSVVWDSHGRLVYSAPNDVDFQTTGTLPASLVTVVDAGGFYTGAQVEAILAEVGTSLASLATGNVPTGAMIDFCGGANPATPPTGFVFANSTSIGNVASNATGRNNADTAALFTVLWNNYSNTELVIQDSAGTPTTRGASAAADYAANKRMPTPDRRCRVSAGLDNMGGAGTLGLLTAAGAGLDATVMGKTGGTQTHALTIAQLAVHTHVQDAHNHTQNAHTHTQDAHAHTITDPGHVHTDNTTQLGGTAVAGSAFNAASATAVQTGSTTSSTTGISVNATAATNQNTTATNNATTATNQNTGSGAAHQNTQPTIMNTVIIKL